MGERRTLEIGQKTLTGADRPKSSDRPKASSPPAPQSQRSPGIWASARPPSTALKEPLRRDELTRGQAPQGALKKENARLKKLLAEKELDIDLLKEVNRGNF